LPYGTKLSLIDNNSDCTVQPPLYQDRISNSTSMFWPEPN